MMNKSAISLITIICLAIYSNLLGQTEDLYDKTKNELFYKFDWTFGQVYHDIGWEIFKNDSGFTIVWADRRKLSEAWVIFPDNTHDSVFINYSYSPVNEELTCCLPDLNPKAERKEREKIAKMSPEEVMEEYKGHVPLIINIKIVGKWDHAKREKAIIENDSLGKILKPEYYKANPWDNYMEFRLWDIRSIFYDRADPDTLPFQFHDIPYESSIYNYDFFIKTSVGPYTKPIIPNDLIIEDEFQYISFDNYYSMVLKIIAYSCGIREL